MSLKITYAICGFLLIACGLGGCCLNSTEVRVIGKTDLVGLVAVVIGGVMMILPMCDESGKKQSPNGKEGD